MARGSWCFLRARQESEESAAGEEFGAAPRFVQAGAQNLLMTLWSVEDEETARLMADFYSVAKQGGNAPALAELSDPGSSNCAKNEDSRLL